MAKLTPLMKKLKGLTPRDEHLAYAETKAKMRKELELFGADCDGEWSGTYDQLMQIIGTHFVQRYHATIKNLEEIEQVFKVQWHSASVKFIYSYNGDKHRRDSTAFGQVVTGSLADGRTLEFIVYRGAANQGGQRQFRLEGYRKMSMGDLYQFTPEFKARLNPA